MSSQQPPNKSFSSPFDQSDPTSSNNQSSVHDQTSNLNQSSFPSQPNQPINQSFQLNNLMTQSKFRVNKKWILVGLAVGLLIGGVYSFGAFTSQNPQDIVKEFETAVYEGNTQKLATLMVSEDPKVNIDAESLKNFTAYLKEKEKYRNKLIFSLQSSATMYEQNSDILEYVENGGSNAGYNTDIYLYRKEIPLYYDTYEIRVRPYQVAITTNEPDTKIIVNNKELFKTTSTQLTHVATVLPGKHDVKISKSYDFWDLTAVKEVTAIGEPTGKVEVEIKSEGAMIPISSIYPQTKLIVNGKQTNKLVKDHPKFGPVSNDGSMTIQGETELPWGVEKSQEEKLGESYMSSFDLTPTTFTNADARKEVTKIINTYVKQRLESHKKTDHTVFTGITDELKRKWIDFFEYRQDHKYEGKLHDCKIDFHQVSYTSVVNDNVIKVEIPILYHQTMSHTFDHGFKEEAQEEYLDKTLILQYHKKEKKWYIEDERDTSYNVKGLKSYMNNQDVVKTDFK